MLICSIQYFAAAPTEKPDWNKLKEEKKTLREKRRAAQKSADSFEVSIEAKKILESIRSRKCPAAEQIKQLEKLYSMLKGKLLAVSSLVFSNCSLFLYLSENTCHFLGGLCT